MLRKIARIIFKPFTHFIFKVKIVGIENFLEDRPFVLVANHRSMLDVILLYVSFDRDINFMAKKELFAFKPFGVLLKKLGAIPIDRQGNDFNAVKKCIKVLRNGEVLGIFPEGHRNSKVDTDGAKAGAVVIASKCGVPIVTAAIKGEYKIFSHLQIVLSKPYEFEYGKRYSTEECKEITRKIVDNMKNMVEN